MTPMIDYSVAMLTAFADFLASEPIIYLFSAIVLGVLCKAVHSLMP